MTPKQRKLFQTSFSAMVVELIDISVKIGNGDLDHVSDQLDSVHTNLAEDFDELKRITQGVEA